MKSPCLLTPEVRKVDIQSPVNEVARTAAEDTGKLFLEERRTSFNSKLEFEKRIRREKKRREEDVRESERFEKALRLVIASTAVMVERQRQIKFEASERSRRLNIRNPIRNTKFGERMKISSGFRGVARTIGMITR